MKTGAEKTQGKCDGCLSCGASVSANKDQKSKNPKCSVPQAPGLPFVVQNLGNGAREKKQKQSLGLSLKLPIIFFTNLRSRENGHLLPEAVCYLNSPTGQRQWCFLCLQSTYLISRFTIPLPHQSSSSWKEGGDSAWILVVNSSTWPRVDVHRMFVE